MLNTMILNKRFVCNYLFYRIANTQAAAVGYICEYKSKNDELNWTFSIREMYLCVYQGSTQDVGDCAIHEYQRVANDKKCTQELHCATQGIGALYATVSDNTLLIYSWSCSHKSLDVCKTDALNSCRSSTNNDIKAECCRYRKYW